MEWAEPVSMWLEGAGVIVIVLGGVTATLLFLRSLLGRGTFLDAYRSYRSNLGRAILLGLELLVAGDIIATILVEQTLESVTVLGVVVLIRTFLSFSLEAEIEGRWPWQGDRREPSSG